MDSVSDKGFVNFKFYSSSFFKAINRNDKLAISTVRT